MKREDRRLGLAEAAHILRIPYQQAHRLLLLGALDGAKEGSRWYVARASVSRLATSSHLPRLVHSDNGGET
jgi:hypothetical protein